MGYSGRYHAASLAAVFLALAIGILIGVGLGHNVVSGTTKDLEQSLKGDISAARGRADALQGELNTEREFSQQAYPALTGGVLRGQRVAVVALGGLPEDMKGDIEAVVGPNNPTGALLGEVAVVREPPDLNAVAGAVTRGTPAHRLAHDQGMLSGLATRMGRALVTGGAPFHRFAQPMLSRFSGHPGRIDGVIVIRARPTDLNPAQAASTDSLEAGLLQGLERAGRTPVVGVERSDSATSSISYYESAGVSATVDNVDLVSGRVSLAYALGGARGNYGVKPTADRLLPTIGHLAPPPASGTQ